MDTKPQLVRVDLRDLIGQFARGVVVAGIVLWLALLPVLAIVHLAMWRRKQRFLRKHRLTHTQDPTLEQWQKYHRDEFELSCVEPGPNEKRRAKLLEWGFSLTVIGILMFFGADGVEDRTTARWTGAIAMILGVLRLAVWSIHKIIDKPQIIAGSWEDDETQPSNEFEAERLCLPNPEEDRLGQERRERGVPDNCDTRDEDRYREILRKGLEAGTLCHEDLLHLQALELKLLREIELKKNDLRDQIAEVCVRDHGYRLSKINPEGPPDPAWLPDHRIFQPSAFNASAGHSTDITNTLK